MNKQHNSQSGFSLIELMIAMALSLLLILGIATIFSSLKNTSTYSQQLENTQEVLRFTNSIFSRAVHRADDMEITNGGMTLILTFSLDNLDTGESFSNCLGDSMISQYKESYSLVGNELLSCEVYTTSPTGTPTAIGTNIDALGFSINNNLLTVTITPDNETNSVQMMFAQRQAILGLN